MQNTYQQERGQYRKESFRGTNLASEPQIKKYMQLCHERKLQPKNIKQMSKADASKLIEQTLKFNPASPNQKSTIIDVIKRLQDYGADCPMPNDAWFEKLDKKRASQALQNLFAMEKQYAHLREPSEQQLNFMADMQNCPAVEFENINKANGIDQVTIYRSKPVYKEERVEEERKIKGTNWTYKGFISHETQEPLLDDEGKPYMRRVTRTEFMEQIKEKLTYEECSQFLKRHRAKYYEWQNTRVSDSQAELIRTMEQRLANMQTKPVIAQQMDGSLDLMALYPDSKAEMDAPQGYDGLSEEDLRTMSKEDAHDYLNRLQYEVENFELYKFEKEQDGALTFEGMRIMDKEARKQPEKTHEWKVDEMNKMNDLLYALDARVNYINQEVHDALNESVIESPHTTNAQQSIQLIREYFDFLMEEEYVTFGELAGMTEDCQTAQNILRGAI